MYEEKMNDLVHENGDLINKLAKNRANINISAEKLADATKFIDEEIIKSYKINLNHILNTRKDDNSILAVS
jgi:hypothetical protein